MSVTQILNTVVLLIFLAGGIYYSATDNELQGTVVVLLGILYFVGVRQISRE